MLKNVDTADIVALVLIIGCFVLKAMGTNSTINYILVAIAAFYFGRKRYYAIERSARGENKP